MLIPKKISEIDRWKHGKGFKKYSYTIENIAEIKGVTVGAVRQAIRRGVLDMSDMKSICRYIGGLK